MFFMQMGNQLKTTPLFLLLKIELVNVFLHHLIRNKKLSCFSGDSGMIVTPPLTLYLHSIRINYCINLVNLVISNSKMQDEQTKFINTTICWNYANKYAEILNEDYFNKTGKNDLKFYAEVPV